MAEELNDIKVKKEDFIKHKKTKISKEYAMGKTLGEGAFGQVRLAVHKATKQKRAVKILKKTKENVKEIMEEVHILSQLTHPNIMQIFEIFEDNANYYIVSEYCKGGELFDVISNRGGFSEREAAKIMKQLLSGVCYSHQNNIVHRDLKPENILLDDDVDKLDIKIIDWGSAVENTKKLSTAEGTSYYIAPEVLLGEYDEKCDVWSCGVIMYILLCGYPPFGGDTDEEIFQCVIKGEYEFDPADWGAVSDEAKELIKRMLIMNKDLRPSALEVLADPWFNSTKGDSETDSKMAKNVLSNMKKFKKNRKLEQATVGFIVNQLVSKEERKELMKQFQDWDKNGDGVLSRDEIIEGYRKTYGKVDEYEIDNMIKSVDMDGNGVIDYNEFLSCAINKDKILTKDNLEYCFKAFDIDGSGTITIDEISKIFKSGSGKGNESDLEAFRKILEESDANGDGEISFEEFKDIMLKFFA